MKKDFIDLPNDYWQDLVVRMAHHSTAIEGNTLTLGETKSILIDNIIPRQMNRREYYEVCNYEGYIEWLHENIATPIDLSVIKKTQGFLLKHIRSDAGEFKKTENIILGASFLPSHPYQVIEHLQNWIENQKYRLTNATTNDEKIQAIMEQHLQFEKIHPFPDGNGRTGRALIVHSCLKEGIAPIVIEKEQREDYINLLNTENREGLFKLGKNLHEKENKRLQIILNMQQEKKRSPLEISKPSGKGIER